MTGSPSFILSKSLTKTKHALQSWNKNHFGHIQTRISLLTSQLDEVQQLPSTVQLHHLEIAMKVELNELLFQEDLLWKTKSRETWLTCKDLNTKFFHASTLIRRRRNSIDFLKTSSGAWISDRNSIGGCFTSHYNSLFSSSHPLLMMIY
ncbi:hypothetical protein SLA2020_263760 [Shorea laevis]